MGRGRKRTKKPTSTSTTTPPTESATSTQAPVSIPDTAPTAKAVEPTVVDAPKAVIMGPMLRKKELVDRVVTQSGMKKKDVKPVVETMLAVLGDALRDNRELKLPPFGHLKIRREKDLSNGRVLVTKIRQTEPMHDDPKTDDDEMVAPDI